MRVDWHMHNISETFGGGWDVSLTYASGGWVATAECEDRDRSNQSGRGGIANEALQNLSLNLMDAQAGTGKGKRV